MTLMFLQGRCRLNFSTNPQQLIEFGKAIGFDAADMVRKLSRR